jgi:glycosyltransferase involved in cell wall biosynthesis
MWVTDWAVPDYAHRLRAILRDWAPEIVQAEFHVMGQYLPADSFSRAKRILVEHEPGICAATDVRRLGPALARLLPRLEMTAWRRYERALLNSAHVVVVFTNRDRQALSRLARKARFVTIPLGTDCPEHALDPIGTEPPQLLFIGNYNHPPNLDAARWLAECLFPAVQARVAGVRLTLVGDAPPPELRRLAGPSIRVTGRVPELSPYMAEAAVVVAPLRLGGGMRVKVLEALAAGKAVVASPLGAAGLDLTDGRELVLAHDGTQFVQRVVELLEQPERRREIGHNARSWALEHIGWDRPVALYEAVYEELLSEAGG